MFRGYLFRGWLWSLLFLLALLIYLLCTGQLESFLLGDDVRPPPSTLALMISHSPPTHALTSLTSHDGARNRLTGGGRGGYTVVEYDRRDIH